MRALAFLLSFFLVPTLHAQQVADSAFAYPNPNPAFEPGAGPTVCVDAGHHNFHTLDGRYYAFGRLLRGDGFRTTAVAEPFSEASLADCTVLVIANAVAAADTADGEAPNPSAFDGDEIAVLLAWVNGGGRLLLITDHAPWPGAAADLAALLGVVPVNGGATYRVFGEIDEEAARRAAEIYGMTAERLVEAVGTPGSLGDHPIVTGRSGVDSPVRTLMTFGGSAFFPAEQVTPLLHAPAAAIAVTMPPGLPREAWPRYSMEGWLAGGARELGEGRVVFLGEAAMCTAQLSGPERRPMGMNNPLSVDNPFFCLNAVRWLAGVLEG